MGLESNWEMLTSGEKDIFQRTCRKLLKTTFIVKEKDDEGKKMYAFIAKNEDTMSEYFQYMGFDIIVDRDNGVAMLVNASGTSDSGRIQANRIKLKKSETIVLCCLWTIYLDRVRRGNLSKGIIITLLDLKQELEKFGFRDYIEAKGKVAMTDILKLFGRFNLIDVAGKIGEPDCDIKIYPSIQFALDNNEFKAYVEEMAVRLKKVKPDSEGDDDIEDDEEADDEE